MIYSWIPRYLVRKKARKQRVLSSGVTINITVSMYLNMESEREIPTGTGKICRLLAADVNSGLQDSLPFPVSYKTDDPVRLLKSSA